MCERCAALEARIFDLETELGIVTDDRLVKLNIRAGLSRQRASIALMLYAAKGRTISSWTLAERVGRTDDRADDTIKVAICNIRKRMPGAIGTVFGIGYYMTPIGLTQMAAWLV